MYVRIIIIIHCTDINDMFGLVHVHTFSVAINLVIQQTKLFKSLRKPCH